MITIENGKVLYGEGMGAIKANVVIEDDKIVEITKDKVKNGKKIDAKGCIVAPAFINSHVHIGDSIACDVGDGKTIAEIVKPPNGLKHRILEESKPEEIINSMKRSMNDMLASGTSTFVDFREGGLEGILLLEEASEDIQIRKIVLGRDNSFFDPDVGKGEIKSITKNLLKSCDGIGLSGFGEIRDEVVALIAKICEKHGKISAIHTAEYEKLQEDSIKATGKSEVQRAVEADLNTLIHVTSPVRGDLKLIGDSGSSVVSCPRSNGTLSVGIPPLSDMLKHKINVLLGTDNIMFNSPNMLREMEYALKVTRGYYREYFSPAEIFKMATVNAANAFGLDTGCIKEESTADIIIVKEFSGNSILSLINRTEPKDIVGLITEGNIVYIN
ncbi:MULTISPECIES: amidohydrolase family protein [Methanobacterium]|uniref:Amidohydrolase family protein n=1 Tax=Methanobacterium veterum TaxID=408577 RepID=A0A9E5DGW6_9EURY|nr:MULTISPECIES: amidohydrolase family protein [Methanobacterium]MCZ3365051.1 amidohydrolase family protein [Methanobacterium veterum]MCZ3372806.1 amidohydrolase family protein [Methanobacterium veterum]